MRKLFSGGPYPALRLTLFLLATIGILPGTVAAQSNAFDMFRGLDPEQQRAVLESLSGDNADEDILDSYPGDETRRRSMEPDFRRRGLDYRDGSQFGDQEFFEEDPRIKGGDTVLLDLRLSITEATSQEPDLSSAAKPEATEPEKTRQSMQQPTRPEQIPVDPVRAAQVREELRRRARQFLPEDQIRALEAAEELRRRAMASNPYKLDRQGQLWIPGLAAIPLAGLTAEQATERLAREPALELLTVRLTLLTLKPMGVDSLEPFGYDIFETLPLMPPPMNDIPVPAEYVLGPGDSLEIQLLGNTKGRYTLPINRDGEVRLPEIGPVSVAGLTFPQAQEAIANIVAEQMIGTRAVVGMGRLRSIRVLVTGEATQPRFYTVSGLATITNALGASGGVKKTGSLRSIELKRSGKLISRLDLYDLLLEGDSRDDARIQAGDVIFIPPVGPTVSILGEIRRPAIYELRGETTAADLIALGGGLTPQADPRSARIERIAPDRGRVVIDVNLDTAGGRQTLLRSGDILQLDPVRPTMVNSVTLGGHVHRPGSFQHRPGMRLTDLLTEVDDLRPGADLHYVLIRRETGPELRVTALSVDLATAWLNPDSDANPLLAARDQIMVFDLNSGRERMLTPILEELSRQGDRNDPPQTVGVGGRVRMPGQYPLEPGMRVSDLVRAGGSLDEAAYGGEAELTRYQVADGTARETVLIDIDLAQALAGDQTADIELQPFDFLVIKELSQWSKQESVQIEGEVRFPGRYPIKRGETLASVLQRAGGLNDLAFIEGSVFTRRTLRERESQQIERLAERMQRDLAALSIQTSQVTQGGAQSAAQALVAGQTLLDELRRSQPVGRLVINLDRVMSARPGSTDDVVLKDGDRLIVPRQTQEVTVLGEVQSGTSHLFDPGLSRDDYVRLSGGLTQKADAERVYIVRANGGVDAGTSSAWFASQGMRVRPGDTIVVPLDTERLPPLPLWTAVTSIIYNLAVAVAAVNSF